MSLYEISRVLSPPADNPNLTKPKLGLGSLKAVKVDPPVDMPSVRHPTDDPKKARKQPPASVLPWPIKTQLPFFLIEGRTAERVHGSYAPGWALTTAARRWTRRVAWELGELPDQHEAAELFALQHGLSIENCFHRRLMRADVLAKLVELFRMSHCPSPTIPPEYPTDPVEANSTNPPLGNARDMV
jgi:hypothetical protein